MDITIKVKQFRQKVNSSVNFPQISFYLLPAVHYTLFLQSRLVLAPAPVGVY